MQVWNVLHAARWKYRTQKLRQKWPSAHHHTTLSGYIFATKARIDNLKKNLLNSNNTSTCPQNMVNFGPLTAEICWVVWGTSSNFNAFRVFASLLHRRRSTEVNHTLHDIWLSLGLLLLHFIYIFGGCCPLTEFCPLCLQVLRSPILAALLRGTRPAGVSQSLRHGTRNGHTELSQRAPPIFGRAAITLGIGPHSSYC